MARYDEEFDVQHELHRKAVLLAEHYRDLRSLHGEITLYVYPVKGSENTLLNIFEREFFEALLLVKRRYSGHTVRDHHLWLREHAQNNGYNLIEWSPEVGTINP